MHALVAVLKRCETQKMTFIVTKERTKHTYIEDLENFWIDGKMPLKIITDIQTFIAILSDSKNYYCGWQKDNGILAALPMCASYANVGIRFTMKRHE